MLFRSINPALASKYGLEMTTFVIENVSVPPEVEAAIDKRSSMGAVGNLNDYVKFQMAEGMGKGGGTGGGTGGSAAEMAMGFAMANQMMQQPGGMLGAQATPVAAGGAPSIATGVATPAVLQLLSPAQAGELLGVTEADVLTALEAGDLKGKKIGATWRIARSAIDDFLKT